jgi:tRNA nucleotidyltransferase (CCA-adding enzyme)
MDLEDILKQLYPDDNQLNCLSGVVSSMGEILKNSSSFLKVKKVTPAGSFGKKTILKNHLEVDCVYILEHNNISFFGNFSEVLRVLKANLPGTDFKTTKHSITFKLNRPIGVIPVNLLPAFEINSPKQINLVKNKDVYYGSTSLIQKKYFKNVIQHYSRFTDLVRLLKLWRNTRGIPLTSYMLELIISNAICDTKSDRNFPFFLEMCFRTIQSFTDGGEIVPVYWDNYVEDSDINWNPSNSGLLLVDPSDPSENLAVKISETDKKLIRSEAIKGITKIQNKNYNFLFTQ